MIQKEENRLTVSMLCEIANVSRSGYYNWVASKKNRDLKEEQDRKDFEIILIAYNYKGYNKGARGIYMRLLHMDPPIIMNVKKIRRLMKKYTQKQIKELKKNPYTFQVDEQRIFFTVEFKKIFWRKYQAGMSQRAIFKELDYNLDYFGQKQIDSIVQRIKKEAMVGEFTEGYSRNNRMKIKEPDEDISPQNIKQIQNELLYLRQEVDFLKKVLKKAKEP